ncbi:MAG: siphovirus Gp157 family protein [Candidatus Omnitrophica bacterium]|jgi:hypothetical protein|nr:siphovirus Gp157 family protein [Candidatus Omnitrophota bacterium]
MSKPVFTIISEYDAIISEIEELGGEITPELAVKLAINEQELAQKIRAYYFVIKTKEAEINLAKEEQERLNDVRKTKENVIKRLKNVVDLAVETFGIVKPSGAKGIDLGNLKVWQKKTIALELLGDIDDARFCNKQISFSLTYEDANYLLKLIEEEGKNFLIPTISNQVLKDKLKSWLIDNEDYLKELKKKASEITDVEFEEINGIPLPVEETQEDKDLKVILASNIKHNSTVIFK